MTDTGPVGDAGTSDSINSVARDQLNRAAEALNEKIKKLEAGSDVDAVETKKRIRAYGEAVTVANKEKERLDEQLRKAEGAVCYTPIDFDVARAEIGRRLDRLRAARGSDGLSG